MIWIGTSGYSYPEWKGKFYPEKIKQTEMLHFYCRNFNSVEINNTFYRLPDTKLIEHWVKETPEEFRFSFKAPQQITHFRRLKNCKDVLNIFFEHLEPAKKKLGAVLFQLPPNFKKDIELLRDFLQLIPPELQAVFEFRNTSWFDRSVFDLLGQKKKGLCIADSEKIHTPANKTSDFCYFRLRDEGYTEKDLVTWSETVHSLSQNQSDSFVYFKHEERAIGPEFAKRFRELLSDV